MNKNPEKPPEDPLVSTSLEEVRRQGRVIHSFVVHPDGSVQDVIRRRPREEGGRYVTETDFAEAAREIREGRK